MTDPTIQALGATHCEVTETLPSGARVTQCITWQAAEARLGRSARIAQAIAETLRERSERRTVAP